MAGILLVDAEASARNALRKLLERGGFEVRGAASGTAALEAIGDDATIEAVVSDFVMSEVNGLEFYDRLVARVPRLPHRVVFLVSANAGSRTRTPCGTGS